MVVVVLMIERGRRWKVSRRGSGGVDGGVGRG